MQQLCACSHAKPYSADRGVPPVFGSGSSIVASSVGVKVDVDAASRPETKSSLAVHSASPNFLTSSWYGTFFIVRLDAPLVAPQ